MLLEGHPSNDTVVMMAVDDNFSSATFGALGVDELANIFAFLPIEEICVLDASTNNRWRQFRKRWSHLLISLLIA